MTEPHHAPHHAPRAYHFVCPQCGSPTDGSMTCGGGRASLCEDCVGDREIAETAAWVA